MKNKDNEPGTPQDVEGRVRKKLHYHQKTGKRKSHKEKDIFNKHVLSIYYTDYANETLLVINMEIIPA